MRNWIRRFTAVILVIVLLPWMGTESGKVSAAGEVIEYNDYAVPARSYTASRPASYSGDPDWYASTMHIDIPANTFKMKFDQVNRLLYFDMTNNYMPSRIEAYREALGSQPRSGSRYYHGYVFGYAQRFSVVYSDGSEEDLASLGGGSSSPYYGNGDLSGYANYINDMQTMRFNPFTIVTTPYGSYKQYNYQYRNFSEGTFYWLENTKKPVAVRLLLSMSEYYSTTDRMNPGPNVVHPYTINDELLIPLSTNKKPNLTLTSQGGQTFMNEPGFSTFYLEGYVQDPDNDVVDVVVEIPNVYYRRFQLDHTASSRGFSIPIDVISESIPIGHHTVNVKVIDPFNLKAEASTSFNVVNRLRNKAFYLINTPIDISTTYSDYENDGKYAERYRYDQDPSIFDNSPGMIWDSGLWRSSQYPSFPFTGAYTATFQARDNPVQDNRLDAYRLWSRDNLSSMTFMVHRKPVALFSAKLVNGYLQLTDSSYDLDHTSSPTKGLVTWQWQWRRAGSEIWTEGAPPSILPSADVYEIRLRVRDIDGPSGYGVWSDWMQQSVGNAGNLPPVALFTVDPVNVSYSKATIIADKSFDPDNDPLDIYYWTVIKDGVNQVWASWGGAVVPPNIAAYGVGSYQINLQVHDNRGLWSNIYSQTVQVINHPPAASFSMPNEVYRDTVISINNLTPDPDEDGDRLQYGWYTRLNEDPYYWRGSSRNPVFKVQDVINDYGLSPQNVISDGWEMRLNVSDGSLKSYATQMFTVKNHVPAAAITGPASVNQYDTRTFTSADIDEDSADQGNLRYYWKVTGSNNKITMYQTPNISLTFDELGTYTLEHWAVDPIGDKSNIASLKVSVIENKPPSMTLVSPGGAAANPTVIDAELEGDPLIKWIYADTEGDPQESYRLEFFKKGGLLAYTAENNDSTGTVRQYQVPNSTLERFMLYTVQGRAFSKRKWSDYSNEKAFIIDNPPQPGFTLMTDTGRNAATVPIYRTDKLNIQSTATDPDIPQGDAISYKYYLKPQAGAEGLASIEADFTKQFTTNGTFTLRQVVTDSLGLIRELQRTITVVNRVPAADITYPTGTSPASPAIVNTLTPVIKWSYQDDDGDLQQRYKVRIINLASGTVKAQSGEQVSAAQAWQVPEGVLAENEKYAVEVEVFDGFGWSNVSPRKYMMVNLLSVKGAVRHTEEWNSNRQAYNVNKSGNAESPRGYNVYWAGEKFVLQAAATGLPDTVEVRMTGGYTVQLSPTGSDKTAWTGELSDPSFGQLPDGPVTFTFTATNQFTAKVDSVTVTILGDWADYYQSHRVK
ncbi:hypothetical protein [Paenibacillus sp. MMS20-IR301]|uniref:hypothetical protein n=1 Tax=Paenibacillus sp. MMS20-IR301 TaxID=2895946 RepID=UPI0028EA8243|nr:hypothetical protein [Paenibacillus sp. MMS20-IR301]WNS41015.1 hypothetical protein LOS79_18380 [Paenibacillus sp. MMS20-IR301]